MKNWRDYAGYGEAFPSKEPDKLSGIYLTSIIKEDETTTISLERFLIPLTEFNLTEEEVGEKVEELLNQFPIVETKSKSDVERERSRVAKVTRRGFANTQFNNTHFYKGSNGSDAPIIVTHNEGKFHVFKHPKFEQYGFTVKEGNESGTLV